MSNFDLVWEDFKRWFREPDNAMSSFTVVDRNTANEIVNNDVTAEMAVSKYGALKNHKEFKNALVKQCKDEMPDQFKK